MFRKPGHGKGGFFLKGENVGFAHLHAHLVTLFRCFVTGERFGLLLEELCHY